MRKPDQDDPKVWEGFRSLCTLLAPAPFNRQVAWEAVDWDAVVGLAQSHKVGPAVWRSIDGVAAVPNPIKAVFHVLRDDNARRNSAIMDDLAAVLAALEARGVAPVLLKGAASLADGLYDDPAERLLLDIDLLVAPDEAAEAAAALRAIGCSDLHPGSGRWVELTTHHLPPMRAPSGKVCIELHTALVDAAFEPMLPRLAVSRRASVRPWRGTAVRVLHPTDRVVHNIVHSQLHHELSSAGMVELRQLRELGWLVARDGAAIDWSDVARRFRAAGHARTLSEQATYCRALMAVAWPIAEADPERAMQRLRAAVVNPRLRRHSPVRALGRLVGEYALWFARNPLLALNLINPAWWPARIRRIVGVLKHGEDHQA